MLTIIDASVAVKWFLQGEVGREAALIVLDKIKDKPSFYAVPDLFFSEMLHVLCRIFSDAGEIEDYVSSLLDLGINVLRTGKETLLLAITFAKKNGLSGYDAIYAANAKLVKGVWLTADQQAHRKIASLNFSRCLS